MAEIKVLCFSSNAYNLVELESMTEAERYDLAHVASNFGYDEADILSLREFQKLFNDGTANADENYIFFYVEG